MELKRITLPKKDVTSHKKHYMLNNKKNNEMKNVYKKKKVVQNKLNTKCKIDQKLMCGDDLLFKFINIIMPEQFNQQKLLYLYSIVIIVYIYCLLVT